MARYTVVVVNPGYESYDVEREILAPLGAEVIVSPEDCRTAEEVVASAADADAILVREAPISAEVLDALTRCRAVVRYGVGIDNIDLDHARHRRIYVANVPGYGTEEVSDHAAALLLACIRRLRQRDAALRRGVFESSPADLVFRTTGKTLGLVGYGRIGRALHRKWKGFLPARVLVCDPLFPPEEIRAEGGQPVELHQLLAEADYISLHMPLTAATRHLIGEAELRQMKPTAILVNTARGEVVDERALVRALEEQWILAAGLDVFESEPLPPDHPLLGLDNVVASGHAGWYSKDAVHELQTRAAREVARVLGGELPECWVNPWPEESKSNG